MRLVPIVIGTVVILVGVLLFLGNLNVLNLDVGDLFSNLWPSILILIGLVQLYASRGTSVMGPLFLILLGVVLQLAALDIVPWSTVWPVVIIGIGLAIIFQGRWARKTPSTSADGEDTVNLSAIFSGIERRVTSSKFRGGKASALFGGVELDLRDAQLTNDAILDVSAFCGGVELKVPENWDVQIEGSPLFGGIEDKGGRSNGEQRTGPTLRIRASITCGGLEIKR